VAEFESAGGRGHSISETTLKDLLKDPNFAHTLDQRQFIAGHGVAELRKFAETDQDNRTLLAWFLHDTRTMDLYLEAVTGQGSVGALERLRQIIKADPDAKQGVYLKLAMAIALWPPGGKSYGSELPIDWMSRYKHYKAARENKELFPSFDTLSVWDMKHVVSGWSSDRDRAWARQMVSTWRPDLRTDTKVINIVSEVWRRFSPFPFSDGFVSVMAGGGKCGPRSWFGQRAQHAWFVGNDVRGGRATGKGNADVNADASGIAKGTRTTVARVEVKMTSVLADSQLERFAPREQQRVQISVTRDKCFPVTIRGVCLLPTPGKRPTASAPRLRPAEGPRPVRGTACTRPTTAGPPDRPPSWPCRRRGRRRCIQSS